MTTTLKEAQMATKLKLAPVTGGVAKTVAPITAGATALQPAQPSQVPAKPAQQTQTSAVGVNKTAVDLNTLQTVAMNAVGKLNLIKSEMQALFLEREEVIEDMVTALVAGHHILLLGPPGTGKSAITEEFTKRIINARMFGTLLNRTSDPSEVIGPVSIRNMERDKFVRVLNGKIADCEIAFVDEIFKANEPTLNSLLPILNERVVYNDGQKVPVPLKMMVAASNEFPEEGEGLEALYDRILFKHWVNYIQDPTNRQQMMLNYSLAKNPTMNTSVSRTTITLDEVEALQEYKNYVTVPKAVIKTFAKLLKDLNKAGITFSDRKLNWCVDVMKAAALINGRTTVEGCDINSLVHILWEKLEDISAIEVAIAKVVDPYSAIIKESYSQASDMINNTLELYDNNPQKGMEETLEVKEKVQTIINKMDKTIADARKEGVDVTKFAELRNAISKGLQDLVCKTLGINQPTINADGTFGSF